MQKEQFIKYVTKRLGEITGCGIYVYPTKKNNGIELTTLIIKRENKNVHPSIYIEPFYDIYKDGEDIEVLVERMLELEMEANLQNDFDASEFTDFNKVRDNVCFRLVNLEANKELLETVPYQRVRNLVKIYCVDIENSEFGTGSILIRNEHLEMWGISKRQLFRLADKNTEKKYPPTCMNMNVMLQESIKQIVEDSKASGEIPEEFELPEDMFIKEYPMYVATNNQRYYGASVLVYDGLLETIAEKLNSNVVIFPSSVHEFIFMSSKLVDDYDRMKEMVETINRTEVAPEDYLSDNVYYYNRDRKELCIFR